MYDKARVGCISLLCNEDTETNLLIYDKNMEVDRELSETKSQHRTHLTDVRKLELFLKLETQHEKSWKNRNE